MTGHENREDRRARWARDGIDITPNMEVYSGEEAARRGRALLESALDEDELATLNSLPAPGRPSVGTNIPKGESPQRRVRLPRDLDDALAARAEREGRTTSAVMRDALTAYLRAS